MIKPGFLTPALLATFVLLAGCSAEAPDPGIPQGAGFTSWSANGAGGEYVLNVIDGRVPANGAATMSATVLTDANCAPDEQGTNHCHNIIEFDNGQRIEVVNNHKMMRHRCLRPGESVNVSAMGDNWIRLQTRS